MLHALMYLIVSQNIVLYERRSGQCSI